MAGIGFRLQKLLAGESYTDLIRAYLYSSVITSGPMIIVMITLMLTNSLISHNLDLEAAKNILPLIIYVYAFSMVGVGPFVYVVTRNIADKYYLKEIESFTPIYFATLEIVFISQTLLALPFLVFSSFDFTTKWVVLCLYLLVSGIWVAMLFLSAARSYLWIVGGFIFGGLAGLAFSWFLSRIEGPLGFIKGYTLGQGVTFLILCLRIFKEFGYRFNHDYGFLLYFKRYNSLAWVGFFYYAGIWVDKFIFWFFGPESNMVHGLKIYNNYDTPLFLSFISVIPSMAFFLIQMETNFVRHYHSYYKAIRERGSLLLIREKKKKIIETLSQHFQKFAILQGLFTAVIILFIVPLSEALGLNPYQVGILRISLLGSYLLMGYVMVLNILFYFELQKEAFWISAIFFFGNALFTFATLKIGFASYGFGYTLASFVSVMVGFIVLNRRLEKLNCLTFMNQPILVPQFKLENEEQN